MKTYSIYLHASSSNLPQTLHRASSGIIVYSTMDNKTKLSEISYYFKEPTSHWACFWYSFIYILKRATLTKEDRNLNLYVSDRSVYKQLIKLQKIRLRNTNKGPDWTYLSPFRDSINEASILLKHFKDVRIEFHDRESDTIHGKNLKRAQQLRFDAFNSQTTKCVYTEYNESISL